MEPIISLRNVHFKYPGTGEESLRGLTLDIAPESFNVVLGRNGSGKSTFAKLLNGLYQPAEGQVIVNGMLTSDEKQIIKIRQTIGLVFQNPDNQIVTNVVEDDIAFAPENLGLPPAVIRSRVDEAMKLTGIYDYRLHAPHLLSGGQKQRVAIAGVLAMNPQILVLDEPTAMLDPKGREDVIRTLYDLRKKVGITVILITHHMQECINADRVLIFHQGTLAADGRPSDILTNSDMMEKFGLKVPETVALANRLRKNGIDIPKDALSVNDCAAAIAEALLKKESV